MQPYIYKGTFFGPMRQLDRELALGKQMADCIDMLFTRLPADRTDAQDMADARDIADEQHNDNNAEPDEGPEALDIRERNEQLQSEQLS